MSETTPRFSPISQLSDLPSGARSAAADWAALRQDHGAYLDAMTASDTAARYALPEAVIDRLGETYRGEPPLLDPVAVAAERALLSLCRAHNAVGFLEDRPIWYRLLDQPLPLPAALLERFTTAQQADLRRALAQRDGTSGMYARLRGRAGWLLTEPAFLDDVTALQGLWRGLPRRDRPGLPLQRPPVLQQPPDGDRRVDDACTRFAGAVEQLCRRWELAGLASWDLPNPQGLLPPGLLPPGSSAIPPGIPQIIVPASYPLIHDDRLLEWVRREQRAAAREAGFDAGWPSSRFRHFAQVLEVLHLERAITARSFGRRRAASVVTPMIEAITNHLGLAVETVRKLRKDIAARRSGRRGRGGEV